MVVFALTRGHIMGLASAVNNFNRVPELVTAVGRRVLAIPMWHYFDDYGYVSLAFEGVSAPHSLAALSSLVGFEVSPDKHCALSIEQEHLGLRHDFTQTKYDAVCIDAKAGRIVSCIARIDSLLSDGEFSNDDINSLRGELVFMMCTSLDKQARGGMKLLTGSHDTVMAGLVFFRKILDSFQPRTIPLIRMTTFSVRCYSDACWEPRLYHPACEGCIIEDQIVQAFCGLGGLVAVEDSLFAVAAEAKNSWHSFLKPRITQIAPAELLAVCGTVFTLLAAFQGQHTILFIDNAAICSALVAGKSSQTDLQHIITAFHIFMCVHHISWWIEWVPSDSNPSDVLSRELAHPTLPVCEMHIPWWAYPSGTLNTLLDANFHV